MPADIFISHASQDREAAEQILAALEARGFSCWIAVRDIPIGATYSRAIMDAIGVCRAMVVVVSAGTSASPHVVREVERAVDKNKSLLPVRIEDVRPAGDLEYFLSAVQWVDAFPAIRDEHVRRIAETLQSTPPAPPHRSSADRVIAELRMRTLAATSSGELKRTLHEVNEFLQTHPHHAGAMMLRDELTGAIAAEAERGQPQRMYSVDTDYAPRSRSRSRTWMAGALASLAVIAVTVSLQQQGTSPNPAPVDPSPAGPVSALPSEIRLLSRLREGARPEPIGRFEFSALEAQLQFDLLPSVNTAPRVRFVDGSVSYSVIYYSPGRDAAADTVVLITAAESTGTRAYFPDTKAGRGVLSAFAATRDGVTQRLPDSEAQQGYDRALAALARYARSLESR